MSSVRSEKATLRCERPACRKVFNPFQLNQRFCSGTCAREAKRKAKAPAFAFDALMGVMGTRRTA